MPPPWRVLQVLEATEGGTRTHLRDLVLGLDASRFNLSVAVSVARDPGFQQDLSLFRDRGVSIHVGRMVRAIRPLTDLQSYRWLRRLLRAGDYHLVHAHSSKAGFLARAAARAEGVPVVVYTPNAFAFQSPAIGPVLRGLAISLERRAAGWTDRILCVSEGELKAARAIGIGPDWRLEVLPNGIDLARLDRQAASGEGRTAFGVPDGVQVVLTVGRRTAQKGEVHLLDAWSQLGERAAEAMLVLVGDGDQTAALMARAVRLGIAERVRFLPRVDQVGGLYAAADVYVLPSLYEGCPYTLMEAMASGLPAIATAVAGSAELIEDGVSGRLVPPADPAALATVLGELLGDSAQRQRLGGAARARAREHFSVTGMVERTSELYERLLAKI